MTKFLTLLSVAILTACGGGTSTDVSTPQAVKSSVETTTDLPTFIQLTPGMATISGFVAGPVREPIPVIKLSVETLAQMPPPFVTGPNPDGSPSGPFVAGPPPFVTGPQPQTPTAPQFVVGPQPQTPTAPQFVVGPSGTVPVPSVPVVGPGPVAQLPFVTGPVAGPIVTLTPPIVIGPSVVPQPVINYCTDGFVVGPCTPLPSTCKPDTPGGFVTGPCSP